MTLDESNRNISTIAAFRIAALYQLGLVLLLLTFLACTGSGLEPTRLANLFSNWDARHYLALATYGYETTGDRANSIVFFPLFPTLIWVLSALMSTIVAGLVIVSISSIIGHAYFILLMDQYGFSRGQITRTFLLLMFCPTAIYFTLNYNESLLFGTCAVFLYFLEKRKFLGAAVLGCLAAMTKLVGLLTILPFLFYCIEFKPIRIYWRRLVLAPLISLGYLSYLLVNKLLFNDYYHYMLVQAHNWGKKPVNPVTKYVGILIEILHGDHFERHVLKQTYTADYLILLAAPILVCVYLGLRRSSNRLGLSLVIWTAAQLALFCAQSFWLSSARYVGFVIPLYIMLEDVVSRTRLLYYLTLALFFVGFIYSLFIFTTGWWLY